MAGVPVLPRCHATIACGGGQTDSNCDPPLTLHDRDDFQASSPWLLLQHRLAVSNPSSASLILIVNPRLKYV